MIVILNIYDYLTIKSWYLPSLHQKHSLGWNRTISKGFLSRPYSCNIRFIGVGLESTLKGFVGGGTGYIAIDFLNWQKKKVYHGYDKNETNKLYCYYNTNKDTGSEFIVSDMIVSNYACYNNIEIDKS